MLIKNNTAKVEVPTTTAFSVALRFQACATMKLIKVAPRNSPKNTNHSLPLASAGSLKILGVVPPKDA